MSNITYQSYKNEEYSLVEKWATVCAKRAFRDFAGAKLDDLIQINTKPFASLAGKLEPLTLEARGYHNLLNLDTKLIRVGGHKNPFKTYGDLASKEGFKVYTGTVKSNFQNIDFKPDHYFRKTVLGWNLKTITDPIGRGKVFTAISKVFGPIFSAVPVAVKTIESYHQNQSMAQIGKTLVKESVKALISWEVGNLGVICGTLLFPIAGPVALITGIITMGLFTALSYKALNKIWP